MRKNIVLVKGDGVAVFIGRNRVIGTACRSHPIDHDGRRVDLKALRGRIGDHERGILGVRRVAGDGGLYREGHRVANTISISLLVLLVHNRLRDTHIGLLDRKGLLSMRHILSVGANHGTHVDDHVLVDPRRAARARDTNQVVATAKGEIS